MRDLSLSSPLPPCATNDGRQPRRVAKMLERSHVDLLFLEDKSKKIAYEKGLHTRDQHLAANQAAGKPPKR